MDSWVPDQVFDLEAKMMKGKLIDVLLGVSLVIVTVASDVAARQVVTRQDREWASQTVQHEKALQAQPVPNSVAILYFTNKTELDDLNPVQKGLPIMLITDLAKVEGLRIVERARLEALVSEINLGRNGLTEPADNVQIGRFLRAEHAVGGDILKGATSDFKVDSSLLDVTQEEIFGKPQVEGKLLFELFKMEKELLFETIRELKIKLTPEQEEELRKPLTTNLNALLAWFTALDRSDRGEYVEADENAQLACALDPGLCVMMGEIRGEIRVAQAEIEQERPEDSWQMYGIKILPAKDLLPPENNDDPTDRKAECIAEGYVPVATTCGIGFCSSTGRTSCVGGKVLDSCVSRAPLNTLDATCDGIDDNCNGQIDEDFAEIATSCGVGVCGSTGSTSCVQGGVIDSCAPGTPLNQIDATCDGIDDNCNGQIDEDFAEIATSCGVGACGSTGSTSCVQGGEIDSCVPGAPLNQIDATCDGIDDNCNAQIDEGYVSMATSCGIGACGSTGSTSCVQGGEIDSCVPGAPLNQIDATCDGIDDNCNAQIDEGYVSLATSCGVGACGSTGSTSCVGGGEIDSCFPGLPVAETCGDVVDNDCNGAVDEGCGSPPVVSTDSINTAHGNTFDDPVLAGRVESGEFVPGDMASAQNAWGYEWNGAYTPGLQTIGVDANGLPATLLHPSFLEQINADPYLAYAVQLEEDQLNRQILAMHAAAAQGDLLATINDALTAGDIRSRDDLLMQQADAQAGRVLRDRDGNWVRTQQYILRPDNQTVQMLNVSLRGSGVHAGLSTIDWTTQFRTAITQPLRTLPWSEYLNTLTGDPLLSDGPIIRYIGRYYMVAPDPAPPDLTSMSVKFTNPGGQYLQESRTFDPAIEAPSVNEIVHYQPIATERLTSSQWQGALEYGTDYWVGSDFSPGINPGGFSYLTGDLEVPTVLASVSFHALGDANTDANIGESSTNFSSQEVFFDDIWDALRVNEPGAPDIGDNNLEIVIDGGLFNGSSIDTVYIPLSRMLWK